MTCCHCNHACRQGRDCPRRAKRDLPRGAVLAFWAASVALIGWGLWR